MNDKDAIELLRQCKTVVQILDNQGINAPLGANEKAALQGFGEMLLRLPMKNFRFLAERAGLEAHELGTLKVRAHIEQERRKGLVECPRCGRDKYQDEPHHFLCQSSDGSLVFPDVPNSLMREIIEMVEARTVESKTRQAKAINPPFETGTDDAPTLPLAMSAASKGPLLKKFPMSSMAGR